MPGIYYAAMSVTEYAILVVYPLLCPLLVLRLSKSGN
jgi:hypothetical protein